MVALVFPAGAGGEDEDPGSAESGVAGDVVADAAELIDGGGIEVEAEELLLMAAGAGGHDDAPFFILTADAGDLPAVLPFLFDPVHGELADGMRGLLFEIGAGGHDDAPLGGKAADGADACAFVCGGGGEFAVRVVGDVGLFGFFFDLLFGGRARRCEGGEGEVCTGAGLPLRGERECGLRINDAASGDFILQGLDGGDGALEDEADIDSGELRVRGADACGEARDGGRGHGGAGHVAGLIGEEGGEDFFSGCGDLYAGGAGV